MKKLCLTVVAYIAINTPLIGKPALSDTQFKPPNILLIMADDLGYSDLGVFGSEINTPNIDALAAQGLTLTRFHTAPVCAVTRAMLLSGNDNHIAGMGSQDLTTDQFGYEGHLTDRIVTIPEVLREAGYFTSIVGKWHLGAKPAYHPINKGFDKSFVMLEGAANHYSAKGWEKNVPISPYVENEKPTQWQEGDYSTDVYTSKLIEYLDENKSTKKPFFALAAYTSPHWPLQVDTKYWHKYKGTYDKGYEVLKQQRFVNLKTLGIIPTDAMLPVAHNAVKAWGTLSKQEQQLEARKMALYAGMVDNLDVNIGRIIGYLKRTKQFDNTLILFMSDNGAAGNDFYRHAYFAEYLRTNYTENYQTMGEKDSFISYGPQWAEAGATPFKYYKAYTTQGGMVSPLIISGPGVNHASDMNHSFVTLLDIAPTLYDYANTSYPQLFKNKKRYPLKGASLISLLEGEKESAHNDDYVFALEHRQRVMVRKGDWKLVNVVRPFDINNFTLHNLKTDMAEQKDLKTLHPKQYAELLAEWETYRLASKIQFPTPSGASNEP